MINKKYTKPSLFEKNIIDVLTSNKIKNYRNNFVKVKYKNLLNDKSLKIKCKNEIKNFIGISKIKNFKFKKIKKNKINIKVYKFNVQVKKINFNFNAYVLTPAKITHKGVICLHGYNSDALNFSGNGKFDYSKEFAKEWLKKNYYVIVPELVSSSKISNVISSYFSIYGITFVSFLVNISQVCKKFLQEKFKIKKIGICGISNGGFIGILHAAIDNEIQFLYSSSTLQSLYDRVLINRKSGLHLEKLFYLNGPMWLKYDFSTLSCLICPRPLLFEVGKKDTSTRKSKREFAKIKNYFRKYKALKNLRYSTHSGGHEFSDGDKTISWIDKNINYKE